jgi:hypothetical protein
LTKILTTSGTNVSFAEVPSMVPNYSLVHLKTKKISLRYL